MFRVQCVGSRLITNLHEFAVHESYFQNEGRIEADLLIAEVLIEAAHIVHVQAYAYELLGKTLDDVQVAPHREVSERKGLQVDLHHDLVHIVQVLERKKSEARPLRALCIDLQGKVFSY